MSPALTALVCAVALVVPGSAAAVDPGPGSDSGGDPYFPLDGNGGYDVQSYRIADTYVPDTDRLRGRTVLRADASQELSSFNLDMVLHVDAVSVNGEPADFAKPRRHELQVTPVHPLPDGEPFTVRVAYHGKPSELSAEGMRPGVDLFFHKPGETVAMGEPQNGAWWFAANETPEDKALFDISVRVPAGEQVVSNGELVDRHRQDGWTTWRWRHTEPITTYLAFFAAGSFRMEYGDVAGRPHVYAVSRRLTNADQDLAMQRLRMTQQLVTWLESNFGPYPYPTTGGVITSLRAGYALETATRPVYPWSPAPRRYWAELIVHEQAHQWFGDDVSLRRWKDIWLNEGFATYAEWLYAEQHGGDSVASKLTSTYTAIPADSAFWQVRVSNPGPARMWGRSVYVRGAMTLAALRNRVGTYDFESILQAWASRNSGGNVTGAQFRALAERGSGENLDGFFQHWLDDTVRPAATQENGLAS